MSTANDMRIVEVNTTSCETKFDVTYAGRLCRVRLWAITGGQLAMQVEEGSRFEERFNICELYAHDKWIGDNKHRHFGYYVHQNKENPIGPRIEDLNDGYLCFRQFIIKAWADMVLYEKRAAKMAEAMGGEYALVSNRFYNREDHEYFRVRFEPLYGGTWKVTPVTHTSAHASGPFVFGWGNEYRKYIPQKWLTFAGKVESIMQACEQRANNRPWKINHLNDEEFAEYVTAIRKVQGKSIVTA